MQVRLSRDPYEALGIAGGASAPEIRHAFLTLTKQYHPAKFARMATDVQKLANEVFLMLRAAHDNLSRPSVTPKQSGQIPTLRPNMGPRASSPQPTSANGIVATSTVRARSGPQPRAPMATPAATATQPIRSMAVPAAAAPRPASPAAVVPRTPSGPTPTVPRPAAPARPAVSSAAGNTDRELSAILQLFDVGQITAARVALESLTTRSPAVPRYQSLLHYAKGREAQLAKQIDVARVELQDALQIDPDLQLAKTALAELFTRRK